MGLFGSLTNDFVLWFARLTDFVLRYRQPSAWFTPVNPSSEQASAAEQWMSKLGVGEFAARRLGELSRGEQRMVLLARALVKNPILLILDEPCQGLDSSHRSAIIALIDVLCSRTLVSLIYITHHVDEMPKAITHVMKLQ